MPKNIFVKFIFLFILALTCNACASDDDQPLAEEEEVIEEEEIFEEEEEEEEEAFTGEIAWLTTIGGSGEDTGSDLVATPEGGFLIVGTTNSIDGAITDKTTTDNDVWIVKVDSNGGLIWSKTYGSSSRDDGLSVVATNDGNYIVAGFAGGGDGDVDQFEGFHDYCIIKINPSGAIIWDKSFGFAGGDQAKSIINTNDGGYAITGYFDVTSSEGQGNDATGSNQSQNTDDTRSPNGTLHGVGEYWVIKLDVDGNKEWRNYFGGTNDDRSFDIVQTPDNGYLVVGASESLDFDVLDNKGGHDFWVVKINESGQKVWTKSYGGPEIDNGYAITATQDGNYIFVGDTRSTSGDINNPLGNADSWAIKIGPSGNLIWQKTHGGTEFESARGVTNFNDGTYLITGSTRSFDGDVSINKGQNDAWVYLIDEQGTLLFEKTIGGSGLDLGFSALKTSDNAIVMVGETESTDGDINNIAGIKDLLLVKIK